MLNRNTLFMFLPIKYIFSLTLLDCHMRGTTMLLLGTDKIVKSYSVQLAEMF